MLSNFNENHIQLRIKDLKGKLIIKIKNSYNGVLNEENNKLISTKSGHSGLGLKVFKRWLQSIKEIWM